MLPVIFLCSILINHSVTANNDYELNFPENVDTKNKEQTISDVPPYEVYTIGDLIFRPLFLIKLGQRKQLKHPYSDLNNLEDISLHDNENNGNDNYRIIRSALPTDPKENSDIDFNEDLNVAESSIPFHPLFAINHRKEVKRRYGRT